MSTTCQSERECSDDDQGKLPLRGFAIRSQRDTSERDALHLLALRQARRVVGVHHAGPVSPDHAGGESCDLSMGQPHRQTPFLRQLRVRHLFRVAGLVDGKPDFDNPRVGVNARLMDDFDLDAVPVTVIDGKNLW